MRMLRSMWRDEAGFIISAELVLVATILVGGLIVGMVSLRDQVVQELVDVGQAIGSLSQSYAFSGVESRGTSYPCFVVEQFGTRPDKATDGTLMKHGKRHPCSNRVSWAAADCATTPCFETAWTDGSWYLDRIDFCQAAQVSGSEPGGISCRVRPVGAPTTPPGGEI